MVRAARGFEGLIVERPGPAPLVFTDADLDVDEPLPEKVGTTELRFEAPPWD